MSYEVGTRIDLSYLNRRVEADQKKTVKQEAHRAYLVGTQFIFNLTPEGLKAAIRIPVAIA